jgi:plasmid stabilization system protein ParE
MKLPVIYTPVARQEFSDAADWYDRQRGGLGDRFVDEILSFIDRICEQPTSFPVVKNDVRQAIVRKYPFSILYQILDNRVVVLAVFHSSRDPQTWQDRT